MEYQRCNQSKPFRVQRFEPVKHENAPETVWLAECVSLDSMVLATGSRYPSGSETREYQKTALLVDFYGNEVLSLFCGSEVHTWCQWEKSLRVPILTHVISMHCKITTIWSLYFFF